MIKTKSRLFNISSGINCLNGDFKSQVSVSLPNLTFHLDNIQNSYLSVVHCEVPNSFYIVNYTNNNFVLNNVVYTLTRGNYNINTFITHLLTLIPAGYTLTYSSITTKITMSHPTTPFTINASSTNCTVNKIMGLGITDLSGLSIVMPNVVNFIPLQRINFRSTYFNFGCYNSIDGSSDIFLPLQNNAGQNSIINYVNQTQHRFLIQDRAITTFIINVSDDYGNLINFNGVDWLMTLEITYDYLEPVITSGGFNNIVKKF